MKGIEPNRPISVQEQALLRAALERAPRAPEASALLSTVGSLQVVGQCECGCGSISFASVAPHQHPLIVADAIAESAHGSVGIIVRAVLSHIVELELYALSAEPSEGWPTPGSVRPWEAGHAAQPTLQADGPASGGPAA